MFSHLHVYHPRERVLVGLADVAVAPLGWFRRRLSTDAAPVRRILVLRLERIGDLLMVLDALHDVRAAWPEAQIDLAIGSWNEPLARLLQGITRLHVIDVPWLARDAQGLSWPALITRARHWRRQSYDLVINFEPDIRSNSLAWLSGARRRLGFWTGGGGAFLTDAIAYEPLSHVGDNARRLVAHAAARPVPAADLSGTWPRLSPPRDIVAHVRNVLGDAERPLIGIHASGGREVKQWHLDRFAAVGRRLADAHGGTLVLTGAASDRAIVDAVKRQLGTSPVIDVAGVLELPELAALLERLDLLITGDTGPMHLAAAMGTPLVALFGPSDPRRYGPRGPHQRVLRIDLPCAPCGRVRLPPNWCRGHVPACLDGIQVDAVLAAATELLGDRRPHPA